MSCMVMKKEPLAALANAVEARLNCDYGFWGFEAPKSLYEAFRDCWVYGAFSAEAIYNKLYAFNIKAYNSRYAGHEKPGDDIAPAVHLSRYKIHHGPEYREHGFAVRPWHYHLAKLLAALPSDIVDTGPNYITLQGTTPGGKRERDLLVFNPSPAEPVTIDLVARGITTNYKMTKYHLRADKSCLNYWAQLNFSSCLEAEDIRNINYMSGPYVEYAVVPRWEQYYTSVELAPHDIMLLKFSGK